MKSTRKELQKYLYEDIGVRKAQPTDLHSEFFKLLNEFSKGENTIEICCTCKSWSYHREMRGVHKKPRSLCQLFGRRKKGCIPKLKELFLDLCEELGLWDEVKKELFLLEWNRKVCLIDLKSKDQGTNFY